MITINFASIDYRRLSRVFTGLAALCALLLASAAFMAGMAYLYRLETGTLERNLSSLEAAHEKVKPLLMEREQITRDLAVMSGLMESRRFSWTRLFTDIEAIFPKGVAVSRVNFNPLDSTLSLEGTAQSPEALRNLMVGLEKSAAFRDPLLKHQTVEKGSNTFNVVAFYTGNKTSRVAQGK